MINSQDILILCCHIKRNLFFEDSMRRLYDAGFTKIWLQQTGSDTFGSYLGPYENYWYDADHYPAHWETGLKHFHKHTNDVNYQYIFLGDFDLYFLGVDDFCQTLEEFIAGDYMHVSRFKSSAEADKYNFGDQQIIEVTNLEWEDSESDVDIPTIKPHFATGFEFFHRNYWEILNDYNLSDGRRIYREGIRRGFKFGAHKATYGRGEQCWGKDWWHMSNLTYFYHMVDGTCPLNLDPENSEHLWRIGFFAAQEEIYGTDIYPLKIKENLSKIWNNMGGRDRCLDAWQTEVQGKPMEHWKPHDRHC